MTELYVPLEYVRMFAGKRFVVSPEYAIVEESIGANLHDLLLISDVGVGVTLVLPPRQTLVESRLEIVYSATEFGSSRTAAELAARVNASKLIYLCAADGIHDSSDRLINRLDIDGAKDLLESEVLLGGRKVQVVSGTTRELLEAAIFACSGGVDRVHFIRGTEQGTTIREVFTSGGVGTMLTCHLDAYERLSKGNESDRERISDFLSGCGIRLPLRAVDPAEFVLFCEDDEIQGTVCLKVTQQKGQLSCIAVQNHLRFDSILRCLLNEVVQLAGESCTKELVVGPEYNQSWLLVSPVLAELGFIFKAGADTWRLVLD